MEPISDEVKRAFYAVRDLHAHFHNFGIPCPDVSCRIVDAYRHERAMRMKAEWLLAFQVGEYDFTKQHWTDAQWEAAVDEELK